jgi:hypothetical protein
VGSSSPSLIEDALASLLQPLAIGLLAALDQLEPSLDGHGIRVAGVHEGEGGPGRVDDLAGLVLDVAVLVAGRVVLAPAAVVHLLAEQERAGALDGVAVAPLLADGLEALQGEEGGVVEADGPGAVPAAVRVLAGADKGRRLADGAADVVGAVVGVVLAEHGQRRQHGRRALGVRVLDHDAVEDLGRVEVLEVLAAAGALVAAEAAVAVLHDEHRVDAVLHAADVDELGIGAGGRRVSLADWPLP